MRNLDIIRTCLRNLTKRKLRTLLTVSGVFIGTGAVIVMISLGEGMNAEIDKMLSEWADLTMIEIENYSWSRPDEDIVPPDLNDDMIRSFKDMKHVKSATPFYTQMQTGNQVAIYDEEGWMLQYSPLIGVYMDELEDFGFKLKEGRFKQEADPKTTVVFGSNVGSYLYNYNYDEYMWAEWDYETWEIIKMPIEDYFNKEFRIIPLTIDTTNWWLPDYTVIGSKTAPNMEYDEELKLVGVIESGNDWYTMEGIFIDVHYLLELVKAFNELNPDTWYEEFNGTYQNVRIRVDDMKNVPVVEAEIKAMGFRTRSYNEMRENMANTIGTIQLLLAAIAAVSLFVAALNIANTMIMAIIERTKEIGIMKVLGCDVGKIRLMFLGEAASIGFIGGILGIGLSYLLSFLINNFFGSALMGIIGGGGGYYYGGGMGGAEENVKTTISIIPWWLALSALGGATIIGMLAGFYPAHRSTRISALSAIAHE